MAIHNVKAGPGEPNTWKVEKVADIGYEDFVRETLDLRDIIDAGMIFEPQRAQIKEALTLLVVEGFCPAYLELQQIRELAKRPVPLMNQQQLFEDLARKLWKAHKVYMQNVATLIEYDIGFLYGNRQTFKDGIKNFQTLHPRVKAGFEELLETTRSDWQNDLGTFRNEFLEHQGTDRRKFRKFYRASSAEQLFDYVWRTDGNILVMLMEVHLPDGTSLVEQDPKDPGPRWEKRFRYKILIVC